MFNYIKELCALIAFVRDNVFYFYFSAVAVLFIEEKLKEKTTLKMNIFEIKIVIVK